MTLRIRDVMLGALKARINRCNDIQVLEMLLAILDDTGTDELLHICDKFEVHVSPQNGEDLNTYRPGYVAPGDA